MSRVVGLVAQAVQEERRRCARHCEQRMELWSSTGRAHSDHAAARDQARSCANEAEHIRDLIEDEVRAKLTRLISTMRIFTTIRFAGCGAFMLVFAVSCVRSRFSEGRYGVVTDMERFMREACGPYASSLQGDPPRGLYPVRDALSSRRASIQKCYESLFYRSLDLPQGCMAVRFTVDHDRRIRSMKTVWNTTGTALVSKCVQDAAREVGVIQNARSGEYVQAVIFAVAR